MLWWHNPDWTTTAELVGDAYTWLWGAHEGSPAVTASGYSGTAALTATSAGSRVNKRLFPTDDRRIAVGGRLAVDGDPAAPLFVVAVLETDGTIQIGLVLETDRRLTLRVGPLSDGGAIDVGSSTPLPIGAWVRYGLKATLDASEGSAAFRFDGTTVARTAGRTAFHPSPTWTTIQFGLDPLVRQGHLYIADGSTELLNDPLVACCRPVGDGRFVDWPANTGSRTGAVDDLTSDEDATYIGGSGTGRTLFVHGTTTIPPQDDTTHIRGALVTSIVRRRDAGLTPRLRPLAYVGETLVAPDETGLTAIGGFLAGGTHEVRDEWDTVQTPWLVQPVSGDSWTLEDLTTAQFGAQRVEA